MPPPFLSHSQTKSVSARLVVQDSGARSWAREIRLDHGNIRCCRLVWRTVC
jgi:hypothetical protein